MALEDAALEDLRAALDATAELPTEEAVPRAVEALADQTLLVPVADYDGATGNIQLLTGVDSSGTAWIYAFTGEDAMVAGGLTGTKYGQFEFIDVVRMGQQGELGGIVVDLANGNARAHIPGYWLAEIERVLSGA